MNAVQQRIKRAMRHEAPQSTYLKSHTAEGLREFDTSLRVHNFLGGLLIACFLDRASRKAPQI